MNYPSVISSFWTPCLELLCCPRNADLVGIIRYGFDGLLDMDSVLEMHFHFLRRHRDTKVPRGITTTWFDFKIAGKVFSITVAVLDMKS